MLSSCCSLTTPPYRFPHTATRTRRRTPRDGHAVPDNRSLTRIHVQASMYSCTHESQKNCVCPKNKTSPLASHQVIQKKCSQKRNVLSLRSCRYTRVDKNCKAMWKVSRHISEIFTSLYFSFGPYGRRLTWFYLPHSQAYRLEPRSQPPKGES